VSELTPPDDPAADEAANDASLATRLGEMQEEHRALDREIDALYEFPYRDQLQLQRLKKKKLQLKDMIERLKDELIPDLNA
jgi:hypothetical protein